MSPALNGDGRPVYSIKRPASAARVSIDPRSRTNNGVISPTFSRPPSSLGGESHYGTAMYTRPGSSLSSRSTAPPLLGASGKGADNTVVSVRVRPPTTATLHRPWEYDGNERYIRASNQAVGPASDFTFDNVFTEHDDNLGVYDRSVKRLVQGVVDGYHGTVFAYGMTGTGKTYSMLGTPTDPGIIPLALQDVFDLVAADSDNRYSLRVSYLEIYNERIKDLLNSTGSDEAGEEIKIREDAKRGIYAFPVTELPVQDLPSFLAILERGDRIRHSAATDFNAHSSRSHAVVQVVIESTPAAMDVELSRTAGTAKISTLNLIDLAGSEKAASDSERRKEGSFINKSLLTLGTVIAKLTSSSSGGGNLSHVPFRDSKLTRLLQSALSGLSLVSILATIHLDGKFVAETTNTLKFASRAKFIPSKAKRAELFGGDQNLLVQSLRAEISMLRVQLFEAQSQVSKLTGTPMPALPPSSSGAAILAGGGGSRSISGESVSMDGVLFGASNGSGGGHEELLHRVAVLERDRTSGEEYIKHLEQRLGHYEDLRRTANPTATSTGTLATRRSQGPLSPIQHHQQSGSVGNPMVATPRSGENFSLPSRLSGSSRPATMAGVSTTDISGLSPISTSQLPVDLVPGNGNGVPSPYGRKPLDATKDQDLQEQDRMLAQRVLDESQRSRDQIRDLSIKLDRFKKREEERLNTPTKAEHMSPMLEGDSFRYGGSNGLDNGGDLRPPPPVPMKEPPSPSFSMVSLGERPDSSRGNRATTNGSSSSSGGGNGFVTGMLRNLSSSMSRSVGDKENSPPPTAASVHSSHSATSSSAATLANSSSGGGGGGVGVGVFNGLNIKAGNLVHRTAAAAAAASPNHNNDKQQTDHKSTPSTNGKIVTVVSPHITAPRNENFI